MRPLDPVLFRQLPLIQKIVADETWLEGERRGCFVASDDPVVRENVCRVILRVGHELRAAAVDAMGQTVLADGSIDSLTPPRAA